MLTTFERLVVAFMREVAPRVDKLFIDCVAKSDYAVEATDVTFQQTNRPSENIADGKNYFFQHISSTVTKLNLRCLEKLCLRLQCSFSMFGIKYYHPS